MRRGLVARTLLQTILSVAVFGGWLLVDTGGRRRVAVWAAFAIFVVALNAVSLIFNWRRAPELAKSSQPLSLNGLNGGA